MTHLLTFMLALAVFAPVPCLAGEGGAGGSNRLSRGEVAVFKKKLAAVLGALGKPPDGFVKRKDSFDLPAEFRMKRGELVPGKAAAARELAVKGAKAAGGQAAADPQKKVLEAQAKGDYKEMSRLLEEMQQKSKQRAFEGAKAAEDKKLPIEVRVRFNDSEQRSIDPDLVVLERKGVLALKTGQGEEGDPRETVTVYFQPAALADARGLSRLAIKAGPAPSKTSVLSITIELEGPAAEVEAWTRRIDYRKVLAQIDATAE